ncbi:MAG: CarD family transcriptional regulator [Clostridia bacterium]|nr:CarD family transcriptional regulator [Clostridia bacterium]NCC76693.1 CarD family transcriptional regulator [Clostridia bacterium]
MYKINDYVVYGSTGVCKVVDISLENFGGGSSRKYYVLSPAFGNSVEIFIPTDKQDSALRPILTKDQTLALIHSMPEIESEWILDDSSRKAKFSEILQSGDLKEIVRLIKMIHFRRLDLQNSGKHLGNADAEIMKQAEKILHHEFACVLDLQPDDVLDFIRANTQ